MRFCSPRFLLIVALPVLALLVALVAFAGGGGQRAGAAFPGANGKIAFHSYRDGDSEIYAMNADGSGQTNLTNNAASDRRPAWSPDGFSIAFASDRDGDFELYVMNANGSGLTKLTDNPASDTTPAWSPDGSKIAFNSYRDGDWEVYVMNADGSKQTNRTNHPADDGNAAWSPDGSQIAFVSDRDGDFEVYVMNADGSKQTNLTNHSAADGSPDWSPVGSKIVFQSDRDGDFELYVMNANGSGLTKLTDNPASDTTPAWSPDGSKIAFNSYRDGDWEVYVMNADGSKQTNRTNHPASDAHADWQPRIGAGDIRTQLCFAIDGSGSISPDEFLLETGGIATAIEALPQDGSIEVSFVQFAADARAEVKPTIIDSTSKNNVADAVRNIVQLTGATNMAAGIDLCMAQMMASPHFVQENTQLINLTTDGQPNLTGTPDEQARHDAIKARDRAVVGGLNRLDAIAVPAALPEPPHPPDVDYLLTLVYPQDGEYVDCTGGNPCTPTGDTGFVIEVDSFDDYEGAVRVKVPVVTATPTLTHTPTRTPTATPTATPTPTGPPEKVTIRAGSGSVPPGGQVTIPLDALLDPPTISQGSFTVEVKYDPALLAGVDCTADPDGAFDFADCNAAAAVGVARCTGISASGVSGAELRLCDITFEADPDAPLGTSTPLVGNCVVKTHPDTSPIPCNTQDGKITIGQGDVNCDDLANVVDALFILQYEVGLRVDSGGCPLPPPPPDTLYVAGGDVNKDGLTNVVDAMLILQCEVGVKPGANMPFCQA